MTAGMLRTTPEALVSIIELVILPDEPAGEPDESELDAWMRGGEE